MENKKQALENLIEQKGEREAFKSVMNSAMKAYHRKYAKMDTETLTDQAWRFTVDYYSGLKVKLPQGIN